MNTKICCTCKEEKDVTSFYKCSQQSDKLRPNCKQCHNMNTRRYQREHKEEWRAYHNKKMRADYHKNREKKLKQMNESYKKGQERRRILIEQARSSGCFLCGEKRDWLLDFHHIFPQTKKTIIAKCRTAISVIRELGKCVVVCCICHRSFHAGKLEFPKNITPINVEQFGIVDRRLSDMHGIKLYDKQESEHVTDPLIDGILT